MADLSLKVGKRTTIKDVALAAGVSVTTVSNLLNGRISAMTVETRERILGAIHSLDYRPSRVARSLVTHRTATIGLIVAEIETPLFLQATHIIEQLARQAGHDILWANARSPQDEQQVIELLLEKQVDGIIFLSTSAYITADSLSAFPVSAPPLVLVNRSQTYESFDQVNWDNTRGVADAVCHLARLGHRRIALLQGPLNRFSTAERARGYQQGLLENSLSDSPDYLRSGDFTASPLDWELSTRELLSLPLPPTAIIAADDLVAAVVIRTLQRAGMRVPEDIAVIGIDDQPFFCTYLNPALTTVQLPVVEAGKLAVDLLLSRIAGRTDPAQHIVLPCPLIIRESCGASLEKDSHAIT